MLWICMKIDVVLITLDDVHDRGLERFHICWLLNRFLIILKGFLKVRMYRWFHSMWKILRLHILLEILRYCLFWLLFVLLFICHGFTIRYYGLMFFVKLFFKFLHRLIEVQPFCISWVLRRCLVVKCVYETIRLNFHFSVWFWISLQLGHL